MSYHTDKGHLGEQLAMAWLLKQGYWVFKNLAPQGPIDCIAVNENEIILVDVKVLSRYKNGFTRSRILTKRQKDLNVKILYVDIDNYECRWKRSKVTKSKETGQFKKSPLTKI